MEGRIVKQDETREREERRRGREERWKITIYFFSLLIFVLRKKTVLGIHLYLIIASLPRTHTATHILN